MPNKSALMVTDAPIASVPTISVAHLRRMEGLRPLSDRERVEALLRFANTGDVAARALLQASVHPADPALARYRGRDTRDPAYSHLAGAQFQLRHLLARIAADDVSAELLASWRHRAAGLVLWPEFEPDGTRRYRFMAFEVYATEPQPDSAYALLLFHEAPFRGQLCRCKWDQCGHFFVAAQPDGGRGAPIRDYCPGTDHGKRAHQAGAVERMRKSRERARQRARAKQSKQRRR